MSTLADDVLRETYAKRSMLGLMTERPLGEIRQAMTTARRFVLDKEMSRFMADLSTAVYRVANKSDMLDSMRHSAMLPHPVTWVEFDGRAFRERIIELDISSTPTGEPLAQAEDIPPIWGMLMEQHPRVPTAVRLTEFLPGHRDENRPVAMPFSHCWNVADNPLPWGDLCHDSAMFGHGVMGYTCPFIGTMHAKRKVPGWGQRVKIGDEPEFETHAMVVETTGVVRYALAFLAALNDMPVTHTRIWPTGKYYVRGNYKRFLEHTVIRLNLPQHKDKLKVAQRIIAGIHHRAHMVRGFWRKYERKADALCAHEWGAIDDNSRRSHCAHCPSWRTWIEPHQRGDASLGFVVHDYSIGHKAA